MLKQDLTQIKPLKIVQALRNKGFENSEIDKYNLDEMLDYNTYREKQYDKLAQQVRNNIDMGMIYEILEIR